MVRSQLWTTIATRTLSGKDGWVPMPNAEMSPDEALAEKAMGRVEVSEIRNGKYDVMRVRAK